MRADEAAGPTVSELRERIISYCESARTKPEVIEHMGGDRQIIGRLFDKMVGEGLIEIAPGSAASLNLQWTLSPKGRKQEAGE